MKYVCLIALLCPMTAFAQVNASITNERGGAYIEGELTGYTVQANGQTICTNPLAYGRYIACSGRASASVWVDTYGVLGAYIVVDQEGRALCEDPTVYNDFRGGNYIICE